MALNNGIASLCVKGCGFYGSRENNNMCSKCYKDYLKAENSAKAAVVELEFQDLTLNPRPPASHAGISDSCSTTTIAKADLCSSKKTTNRCKNCNKKVGLTGFKCRCGQLFCGVHRYPKEHACTFDFKKADREILVKQNPLFTADKLEGRL